MQLSDPLKNGLPGTFGSPNPVFVCSDPGKRNERTGEKADQAGHYPPSLAGHGKQGLLPKGPLRLAGRQQVCNAAGMALPQSTYPARFPSALPFLPEPPRKPDGAEDNHEIMRRIQP